VGRFLPCIPAQNCASESESTGPALVGWTSLQAEWGGQAFAPVEALVFFFFGKINDAWQLAREVGLAARNASRLAHPPEAGL